MGPPKINKGYYSCQKKKNQQFPKATHQFPTTLMKKGAETVIHTVFMTRVSYRAEQD